MNFTVYNISFLRKFLFCLFAFGFSLLSSSQNLVPNPGFENYSACPTSNSSEVYLATPWIEVQSTADYYNCSALDNNYTARNGTGYMGVSAYRPSWSDTYREYIGVQLTQPLTASEVYYGEFWVRLRPDACWASDGMGMYVSQGQPPDPPFTQCLYVTPQIMNQAGRMLDVRNGWMKICGAFIAQGGEDFITIGSFRDDSQSTFVELSGCPNQSYGVHWSYYHIDDVLLEVYDTIAGYDCDNNPVIIDSTLPLTECLVVIPNVFSANGDGINDVIDTDFGYEKYIFQVFNRWGEIVYETWEGDPRGHFWDGRYEGKKLPDGTYFYYLYSFSENCEKKGNITLLH